MTTEDPVANLRAAVAEAAAELSGNGSLKAISFDRITGDTGKYAFAVITKVAG